MVWAASPASRVLVDGSRNRRLNTETGRAARSPKRAPVTGWWGRPIVRGRRASRRQLVPAAQKGPTRSMYRPGTTQPINRALGGADQDGGRSVHHRMGQADVGMDPVQAVTFERQRPEEGQTSGWTAEQGSSAEPRKRQLRRPGATAHGRRRLVDPDARPRPASVTAAASPLGPAPTSDRVERRPRHPRFASCAATLEKQSRPANGGSLARRWWQHEGAASAAGAAAVLWPGDAPRKAALGPPLPRSRDLGSVHRVPVHHRLPARRAPVRQRLDVPPVEGRGRRRRHRLHPRREGLHHVHAGLPTVSRLGDRDRHLPVRRERTEDEVAGVATDVFLARATDPELLAAGQDGGLVSAILRLGSSTTTSTPRWCQTCTATAAWKATPAVVRDRAGVLSSAGSRYTYSANTLAYPEAIKGGDERIALVGMSCQASAPAVMKARKAGKVGRRLSLSIGLLCSKTFEDAIFEELFEASYGLRRADIAKINIKGVFQIWTATARTTRSPQGGSPVDAGGVQGVPRLRRRARRHRHRRHRRLQRLDADHRAHRGRPRGDGRHARRRRHRDTARRRRPRRHGAAAQAGAGRAGSGGPRARWRRRAGSRPRPERHRRHRPVGPTRTPGHEGEGTSGQWHRRAGPARPGARARAARRRPDSPTRRATRSGSSSAQYPKPSHTIGSRRRVSLTRPLRRRGAPVGLRDGRR